jgi:uncharacterized protein YcfL
MKKTPAFAALAAAALTAALVTSCATKKGFEQPGYAFGCPVGDQKVGSMDDLVKAKTTMEGRRTTIQPTEVRCTKAGDLLKVDANLNNDSSSVKRVAYKFRWIDREGMRAAEEESWKPLMLYNNSNMMISTVAPSAKAVDFRLILMSQE